MQAGERPDFGGEQGKDGQWGQDEVAILDVEEAGEAGGIGSLLGKASESSRAAEMAPVHASDGGDEVVRASASARTTRTTGASEATQPQESEQRMGAREDENELVPGVAQEGIKHKVLQAQMASLGASILRFTRQLGRDDSDTTLEDATLAVLDTVACESSAGGRAKGQSATQLIQERLVSSYSLHKRSGLPGCSSCEDASDTADTDTTGTSCSRSSVRPDVWQAADMPLEDLEAGGSAQWDASGAGDCMQVMQIYSSGLALMLSSSAAVQDGPARSASELVPRDDWSESLPSCHEISEGETREGGSDVDRSTCKYAH